MAVYISKRGIVQTGVLTEEELAKATATPARVFYGDTFYAGTPELQVGTALAIPTNVTAQKMFAGVKAYNQQGQLITGNPTATTATADDIAPGKTAYNNLGQLLVGSGIGKIISGTMTAKSRVYFNGTIIMAALWCNTHIAGIVFPSEDQCAMGNTSRHYGVLRLYDNYIYWDADETSLSGEYWIIYKD